MQAKIMGLKPDFLRSSDRAFLKNGPNAASAQSSSKFTFYAAVPSAPLNFSRHAHTTSCDTSPCHFHSSNCPNDDNDGAGIRLKKKRKRTDNDAASAGPIRKKRRLRLTLITSRLSQPFAVPATHIAGRGPSRIAAWAKQQKKAPWGRALLRKAATLNRATRRSVEQRVGQSPNIIPAELDMLLRRKGVEMARLARLRGSLATVNSTRPVDFPLPYTHQQQQQQHASSFGGTVTPVAAAATMTTRAAAKRVVESPNFRYNYYAPSPPSPLRRSSHDNEFAGEENDRDEADRSEDRAEHLHGKLEVEEEKKVEKEENESAYFDSLIFGIAATAVLAADSPALSNTSVFVSDYDRLDDLAGGGGGGSNGDGFPSSPVLSLSSPTHSASSSSANTAATASTALTDDDDAAVTCPPTADYSPGSPYSMLFFDQLAETIPAEGDDAVAPPAVLQPPLLPLEQPPPSLLKRPPRPKGWNPNFASASPYSQSDSEF
ncbi:uncharacterized protein BKCO1_510003 [Diplodia corticola]|uniref:Uncharacterized protein n=1 Tax=Diplodia corticola TaxID=236234 RepID=A0A1J9QQL9_9PEZI|nr:uncharacterized protein BKCO1_510003 [Diplodia corticola]OJD31230.1 hypothetical protein BKCO1_510003 [Diplodia corticola]